MSKLKSHPKNKSQVKKTVPQYEPLVSGDIIDIVAPGSAADKQVLTRACAVIESWGYRPRVAADLIQPQMFLSHSDQYRYNSLKEALLAKDSKLVWCLRGGYGSIRLLPFLDQIKKPAHKKILLGLSDITSLQIYLAQKWAWTTLHGPLIDRIGLGTLSEENSQELRQTLRGEKPETEFKMKALNVAAEKVKSISGPVIGGNLMVAVSTLGTKYQIQGDGQILFFEELSERGYRIDRCLQQLQQAGIFKKVKAVVFGEFLKCNEPDGTDLSLITLYNFFNELKVPAFHGVELGHGPVQRPLFFNTNAKITSMAIDQVHFKMLVYSPYEVHKPRK